MINKGKKENNVKNNSEVISEIGGEQEIRKLFDNASQKYVEKGKINFEQYFDIFNISSDFKGGELSICKLNEENFGIGKIYNAQNEEITFFPIEEYEDVSWSIDKFNPNEKYILKNMDVENKKTYFFEININKDGKYKLKLICYVDGLTSIPLAYYNENYMEP